MSLNDTKFELLRYGLDLLIKTTTSYTTPAGLLISPKDDAKDLGVIMSNDCSFTKQIDKVITKAKSLILWILRSFKTREVKPMLHYTSCLYSLFWSTAPSCGIPQLQEKSSLSTNYNGHLFGRLRATMDLITGNVSRSTSFIPWKEEGNDTESST